MEKLFDVKESRIKNIEDYFDKFFDQRAGWHQKKFSPSLDDIKKKYDNYIMSMLSFFQSFTNKKNTDNMLNDGEKKIKKEREDKLIAELNKQKKFDHKEELKKWAKCPKGLGRKPVFNCSFSSVSCP